MSIENPATEVIAVPQELDQQQIDALVIRAAEDMRFYNQGKDDVSRNIRATEAARAFVALDSLRVFSEG